MQLSPLKMKKLQTIAEMRDPSLRAARIITETMKNLSYSRDNIKIEVVKGERGEKGDQGEKGKDGYNPVKGQDYFTQNEVRSIINTVQASVIQGRKGDMGLQGENGVTPIKGVDYWTETDIARIKKDIEKLVPKIKEVKPIDIKDIIKELKKHPIEIKDIKDMPDMSEVPQLIKFLKAGGFRGGGDTVTAGTGIAVTLNASGQKVITNTGMGATFVDNEIVAGSGTTFTLLFPQVTNSEHVFAARNRLYPTTDYTINAGGVITTVLSWGAGDLLCDYRKL